MTNTSNFSKWSSGPGTTSSREAVLLFEWITLVMPTERQDIGTCTGIQLQLTNKACNTIPVFQILLGRIKKL